MSSHLPRIALVTTGGTIAGEAASASDAGNYTAGTLSAQALLAAVPDVGQLARIEADPLFAIDSKDMTTAHWLTLARRVEWQRQRADIDAVVVTHGTDTLEESVWFLHLVLPPGKPVVFTAAMRPAGAHGADGAANLHQAVRVAASGITHGLGVVVVMNGQIYGARDVGKAHTQAMNAIGAPGGSPLGIADPPTLRYSPVSDCAGAVALAALAAYDELPPVEVIHVAAGSAPVFLRHAAALGLKGIVLALPGNGSVPTAWRDDIAAATRAGIDIVHASRVAAGPVSARSGEEFPAAGWLSPLKARIVLMLSLAGGDRQLRQRIAAASPSPAAAP